MADTSLVFNILARDKATKTFDKVKARAALLGAAVGAMAFKFGKDGVANASALNETLNKSNVIFGKNAGAVEKWANGAAKNLGLSKAAALESAAGFGNMFSQLGFGGGEAAKMSKGVVRLAADLGSFNNLPTAQVADMMSAAFRGEYDSLQRLIPNINAARVEQEALAMTGKSSAKELTAQEKAAATLAIVQKDGAAAAGDFAKTSGSLANQQKILKARYEDISAAVGQKLLPAVTGLAGGLLQVINFTQRNASVIVPLVGGIAGLAAVVWGVNAATRAWTAAQTAWVAATKVTVVWSKIAKAATKAWAAGQWLLNAALTANPIGLVIAAIALLVIGLVVAWKKSETFRKVVKKAFEGVVAAGKWMWEALKQAFTWIVDKFLWVGEMIIKGAAKAFGWVPGIGPKLKNAAAKFEKFRDDVNAALSGIKDETVTVTYKTRGEIPSGVSVRQLADGGAASSTGGRQAPRPSSSKTDQLLEKSLMEQRATRRAVTRPNRVNALSAGWAAS